jgi:hypothetical protein
MLNAKDRDPKGTVPIADAALKAIAALPDRSRVPAILAVVRRILASLSHGIDAMHTEANATAAAEERARLAEQEAAAAWQQVAALASAKAARGGSDLAAQTPATLRGRVPTRLTPGAPTPKAKTLRKPANPDAKKPGRPPLPVDEYGNKIRSPEAQARLDAAREAARAAAARRQAVMAEGMHHAAAEALPVSEHQIV